MVSFRLSSKSARSWETLLRRELAFTMLELLVVAAVASVLMAVILPALRGVQERTETVRCLNNLRQVGSSLHLYLADHNGVFPPCVDYVPWRVNDFGWSGGKPILLGHQTNDIAGALNNYVGPADGTGTNNMRSPVWVCPTAKKFRKGSGPNPPYYVFPGSGDGYSYEVTYRWYANATRDTNSMRGIAGDAVPMGAHPQMLSRLRSPGKAAVFWCMPDELVLYPGYGKPDLHGQGINCLFVDGHVQMITVDKVPPYDRDTLWDCAAYGEDQGWEGGFPL